MNDFLISERDSVFCVQVLALGEIIRLMAEVDAVIESAGGWPVK